MHSVFLAEKCANYGTLIFYVLLIIMCYFNPYEVVGELVVWELIVNSSHVDFFFKQIQQSLEPFIGHWRHNLSSVRNM